MAEAPGVPYIVHGFVIEEYLVKILIPIIPNHAPATKFPTI